MELRDLRDKATEAFTRGRFAKAAELYQEYCQKDPRDIQAKLRLGDAWARAQQRPRAIAAYLSAAESFAKEGFLPRAIAASKLILELDPAHRGVQQMLADLYAKKEAGAPSRPRPAPAVAPPSAPPAQPRIALELPLQQAPSGDAALPAELELFPGSAKELGPPGLRRRPAPPPPDEDEPLVAAGAPGLVPSGAASAPGGDLRLSRFRFDELSLDDSPPFTELEPDGDTLLHAVEVAAATGQIQRGEALDDGEEEVFSLTAEVEPAVGEARLPHIPLFSDLPADAFIELFERCPLRRYTQGEQILAQGSKGDAFYVVCEGAVRVMREERELACLAGGAFFGEMALLSDAPRSASVVSASEDTQVLEISAPLLAQLSVRFPEVAKALKRFCRQRMLSNVMASSPLFRPFNRSDRRALVERFRAREAQKGEVVIREGAQTDGLYVLLSGEVEVALEGTVLARLHEGEIFGEMSLLKKSPATARVTTSRRSSLLRLPRQDFDALVLSHPQILVLVSELTFDRERHTEALLGGTLELGEEGLMLV